MDVRLRPIDFSSMEDFDYLAKWVCDDEIKHLFTVDFNKGPTMPINPVDIRNTKIHHDTQHTFMIEADGIVIGDTSVDTAFGNVKGSPEGTGWLSICIGEKRFRGKGLGLQVMEQLEGICKEMGLRRLELGVFSYNHIAIQFYERLGYEHFATVDNFTWYDGRWHDDLRMEKYI